VPRSQSSRGTTLRLLELAFTRGALYSVLYKPMASMLVVDDYPDAREILATLFSERRLRSLYCQQMALQVHLRRNRRARCYRDGHREPIMNGVDAVQRIRERPALRPRMVVATLPKRLAPTPIVRCGLSQGLLAGVLLRTVQQV
jgi:CheY-like chemotaxis protein